MKHIINFSQIRPNINIPFYGEILPEGFLEYFNNNYVDTGKFIEVIKTMSEDGLTVFITQYWESEEDYQLYATDTWIIENFLNPSIEYRTRYGIQQKIWL